MNNGSKAWSSPDFTVFPCNGSTLEEAATMSEAELKLAMENMGYSFTKKFQASPNFLHRKIADMDVLISVGKNIANFNGYIEMNASAVALWEKLGEVCTIGELEKTLEEQFGIAHEKAVHDVLEFLNLLQEHQMVTVS